jgi:hypothetical protein
MANDNGDWNFWLEKIQQDAGLLQFVPESLRTETVYLTAVTNDVQAFNLSPNY